MYKLDGIEVTMNNSTFAKFDTFLASLKQPDNAEINAVVESAQALLEGLRFTGFNSNFRRLPDKNKYTTGEPSKPSAGNTEKPAGKPVDDSVPPEKSPLNAGPSGKSNNFDPIKFGELSSSRTAHDLWENNRGMGLRKVVDAINNVIGREVLNPSSSSNNDALLYRRNTPALLISHTNHTLGRITVQVDTKRDDNDETRLTMNPAAKVFILYRAATPEQKLNAKIPLDTCKFNDALTRMLKLFS